jgi:HAD superfamily hydrolase (TIGR01549 family)
MRAACRAVLFDLDGTLLDYSSAQASAVASCASQLGMTGDMDGPLLAFVNSAPVQDIEACRPGAPAPGGASVRAAMPPDAGVDPAEFLAAYFEALSAQGATMPGARECLEELGRGYRLAAVSNGPGPVQRRRLELAGLSAYFDAIVLSCERGVAKPDPAIFRMALEECGVEADEALMIGDSAASDMNGAAAAGIDFVFFRPHGDFGAAGPRIAEIRMLSDLQTLRRLRGG